MIHPDTIKETKFYKGLNFISQKMVRSLKNCEKIDNSLNVISAIGIKKWESQTKPNFINKQIITELLNN